MKTICIAGKNNIAVDVLLYCINTYKDDEIVVVCNKNDLGENGWQRSLLWHARKHDIRVLKLNEVYGIEDLVFLSVEFDRIIRPKRFSSARLFNIHFSFLPLYKGCHTSVLPILHGRDKTGVTFHRIDSGIDTGEIIDQEEVKIYSSDTSYDLYKKLISVGTKLIIKNLSDVIRGTEQSWKQESHGSTYYSINEIKYSELCLDINATAYQIQNQIRAFSFRPYQLLVWNKKRYVECEILENRSVWRPGTILEDTEVYTVIVSIDYDVKLYKDVLLEIFSAIEKKENSRAKKLCVSRQLVNAQDRHGRSPLTVAVYSGNIEMVEYLLQCGADICVKDWNGSTLLMYAKDYGMNTGDWSLFRMLAELGVDINEKDYAGLLLADYISELEKIDSIPDDIKKMLNLWEARFDKESSGFMIESEM